MGSKLNQRIRERFRAPGSDTVEQAVRRVDELNRFLFETVTRWEDEASWVESHLRGLRDERPVEEEVETDSDEVLRKDLAPRKKAKRRQGSTCATQRERKSSQGEAPTAKIRDRRHSESVDQVGDALRQTDSDVEPSFLTSDSKSSLTNAPRSSERRRKVEEAEPEERVESYGEFADSAEREVSGAPQEEAVEDTTRQSPTYSDSAALEKEFALLDEAFGPLEGLRSSSTHRMEESQTVSETQSEAGDSASRDSAGLAPWIAEPMPKDRVSLPRTELERASRPDWKSVRSTADEEWRGRGF